MNASISSLFLFPVFMLPSILLSQQNNKTGENMHSRIYIAAGWHTTLFLDKHSIDDYSQARRPDSYSELAYFKGSFYAKNNFCYSLDYRTYARASSGTLIGDVLERFYTAINLGFGRTIYRDKITTLTPNLYLSSRYGGGEFILLDYRTAPQDSHIGTGFSYRSLGMGAGLSFTHKMYKVMHFGLDLFYNHYFQKSLGYPLAPKYEEYIKNYKVNKDALSLGFTLGFLIDKTTLQNSTKEN